MQQADALTERRPTYLREGTDGGGGEGRKAQVLLLLRITVVEASLAAVHLRGDLGLALLDLGVVGTLGFGARLHRNSVGVQLRLDSGGAGRDRLGKDCDFVALLDGKGEPLVDFLGQLLLAGESVGNVEEGARSSNDDALLAQSLDGTLDQLNAVLEVVLPDITSVDNTGGEDLLRTKLLDHSVQLLGVTDQVDMKSMEVGNSRKHIKVVNNITKVGSNGDLRGSGSKRTNGLVGGLEGFLDFGSQVEDEDRLVDLDSVYWVNSWVIQRGHGHLLLGTGGLERLEELDIDGDELLEKRDGVNGSTTVGLTERQERNGPENDGAGSNPSLLGLEELPHGLGVLRKGEGLVILESGLGVVVVAVEPLHHLQGRDIDTALLVATAHGEVLIDGSELLRGVTLGNGLHRGGLVGGGENKPGGGSRDLH